MPYTQTKSGKLHFEVIDHVAPWHAPGEAILFHHGIGAAPGIWRKWLPALSDRYKVVVFDMRGYGKSHDPNARFDWSLDLLADDVRAVADAAEIDRFHLVGESIGGTVVLKCGLTMPQRIRTLTVSNGAHIGSTIQRANQWRERIDTQGIKAWSDEFMRGRFYDDALDPVERAWFVQAQEAWTRDSILDALAVLVGTDLTASLKGIRCPALLMHGDGSPFIPVSVMAELHGLLPNSSFQVFEHARHGLPFSHALECSLVLRGFLERTGNQAGR